MDLIIIAITFGNEFYGKTEFGGFNYEKSNFNGDCNLIVY